MRKWIWILALLLLCGCAAHTEQNVQKTDDGGTNAMEKRYAVGDVLDTFAWVGKTAEELGIDESYCDIYSIRISGDLFGNKVEGTAHMRTDYDSPNREIRVEEIAVYDDLKNRAGTEEGIVARFGKAFREGMDPYVASNGGATYWSMYWTGEGVIKVANGQNNNWYELTYVASEMPDEIKKELEGLTPRELMYRTGVLFEFKDGEIEDLAIHGTEYEGMEAYRVTFRKDGVGVTALIVNEGEALFDGFLNDGTEWTQERIEGLIDSLRCILEDGTGRIVEKNPFHELWLIETDTAVTPESLEALERFILERWLFKN